MSVGESGGLMFRDHRQFINSPRGLDTSSYKLRSDKRISLS